METPYRTAARRRARKEKALKDGEERQKRLAELRKRRDELRARRAAAAQRRKAAGAAKGARPKPSARGAAPKKSSPQAFVDPQSKGDSKVCPHCNGNLVRVICLQKPILACVNCRGITLSGEVVKQFATQGGWFAQLDAAVSLYARRETAP